MKKKSIIFLCIGIAAYAGIIWLVRTNETAKSIAQWIVGIALAIWGADWLLGQFAGLISESLQEKLAAAFLPITAGILALLPLFISVIIQ